MRVFSPYQNLSVGASFVHPKDEKAPRRLLTFGERPLPVRNVDNRTNNTCSPRGAIFNVNRFTRPTATIVHCLCRKKEA